MGATVKRLLPILALLCFSWPSQAAIAHDADSNSGTGLSGSSTTFTWSHTCTGSNMALVVGFYINWGNVSHRTITGITYNSVSLTPVQTIDYTTDTAYLWLGYLKSPATGSNTIQVTISGTLGAANNAGGFATSFTGVDQSSPVDSTGAQFSQGSATSISVNVTTANANAWIVDFMQSRLFGTNPTANSPQVQNSGSPITIAASYHLGMSYNGPIATPASTSDGWAIGTTSSVSNLAAFSLKPAGAAAVNCTISLLGAGPC